MTTTVAPLAALRPRPQVCRACGTLHEPAPVAICEQCLGPLDPVVDAARVLPTRDAIAARPWSLWRYREWLPFDGEPVLSLDTGGTPLVEAPRLAALLGVARVWVKNDAVSHPSLSFKDRVVATAINAAAAFGLDTIGCASTGNLANAVAAQAARAGLKAWIFIPEDLEVAKIVGTAVFGARLVRVRGHYDDVNRLCAQVADLFGWGIVNVNLRGARRSCDSCARTPTPSSRSCRTPSPARLRSGIRPMGCSPSVRFLNRAAGPQRCRTRSSSPGFGCSRRRRGSSPRPRAVSPSPRRWRWRPRAGSRPMTKSCCASRETDSRRSTPWLRCCRRPPSLRRAWPRCARS